MAIPADMIPKPFETFLHAKIPLSRAMQVRVVRCDGPELELVAPLAPNINHLGTAFGGSLNALATLAGYGIVYLLLREIPADGHVVLKESRIDYLSPVRGRLRANCRRSPRAAIGKFHRGFRRQCRARLDLEVQIAGSGGRAAVVFGGRFVAVK